MEAGATLVNDAVGLVGVATGKIEVVLVYNTRFRTSAVVD